MNTGSRCYGLNDTGMKQRYGVGWRNRLPLPLTSYTVDRAVRIGGDFGRNYHGNHGSAKVDGMVGYDVDQYGVVWCGRKLVWSTRLYHRSVTIGSVSGMLVVVTNLSN